MECLLCCIFVLVSTAVVALLVSLPRFIFIFPKQQLQAGLSFWSPDDGQVIYAKAKQIDGQGFTIAFVGLIPNRIVTSWQH